MITSPLVIQNNGADIVNTNYWASGPASTGALFLSFNAGAARLLVPPAAIEHIQEMRKGAKRVVISALTPELWRDNAYCLEFLIEDGSDNPWAWHTGPGSVDRCIGPASVGQKRTASVWGLKNGRLHKFFERDAYFQIVPSLPWLKLID